MVRIWLIFVVALPAALAADIGETISNTSAILGDDALFSCEIIGTQGVGETLTFTKNTPAPALIISADSDVTNETKYLIDGKYNLTVQSVTFSDEGQYECTFGANEYVAYLIVCDPPTSSMIYWGEEKTDYTKRGQKTNLTCEASTSYPPATFRWYKHSKSLSNDAIYVKHEESNGYGKAYSYLELTPGRGDEGVEYKCYVDIPAKEAIFTNKLTVSFSGSNHVTSSIVVVGMITMLLIIIT